MGWVVNATSQPLYPRERTGTHCVGGWVGPRARLHANGNPSPTGIGFPDRSARSYTDCGIPTPRCYTERTRNYYIHMLTCKWTVCTVHWDINLTELQLN